MFLLHLPNSPWIDFELYYDYNRIFKDDSKNNLENDVLYFIKVLVFHFVKCLIFTKLSKKNVHALDFALDKKTAYIHLRLSYAIS